METLVLNLTKISGTINTFLALPTVRVSANFNSKKVNNVLTYGSNLTFGYEIKNTQIWLSRSYRKLKITQEKQLLQWDTHPSEENFPVPQEALQPLFLKPERFIWINEDKQKAARQNNVHLAQTFFHGKHLTVDVRTVAPVNATIHLT